MVAEVIRDVASTRYVALAAGRPSTAEDVIRVLEMAHRARGTWPLVLGTDGGPAYWSAEVQRFLRERQILHLVNLPHVPQHNAPAERGIGELKGVLEERGLLHEHAPVPEWQERLEAAGEHLDGVVPRTSRGFLTAKAYDQILPSWYDLVDRAAFYEAAGTTAATAMGGLESARERLRAERRAKLDTMDRFGLIKRTRGRASRGQFKAEKVL